MTWGSTRLSWSNPPPQVVLLLSLEIERGHVMRHRARPGGALVTCSTRPQRCSLYGSLLPAAPSGERRNRVRTVTGSRLQVTQDTGDLGLWMSGARSDERRPSAQRPGHPDRLTQPQTCL